MKPWRWLAALLVVVIAVLVFLRHKKEAAAVVTDSPSLEVVAEKTPAANAATPAPAATALASTPPEVLPYRNPDPLENANHLQVTVQNEAGAPLEGASVQTSFRGEQRRPALTNFNRTFTTSAHGMADVRWPERKFEQFELLISKDDYASRKMLWDLKAGDDIPATFTVRLKSGVHVGGFVVDPEGNPVADATVTLNRFWSGGERFQNKGEEAAFPTQKHTTGPDGRWAARNLPPELLDRISIEAGHTNFIGVRVTMDGKAEIEQELRDGKYQIQLKRGLEARGRVVNEQQQPIADAQVSLGRKYSRERQETKSDPQGRFTFRNVNEGKADFSVMADGYAPDVKSHTVSATSGELIFQLAKGSVIRGTVQDESNQPIEGVRAVLEGSPGDPSYDRFSFSATTDAEGKFEWKSAPNTPMPFYFGKSGYEQKRNHRLKPAEENVITLRRSRQIVGLVLNAENDQPVTNFTVSVGRLQNDNRFFRSSSSDTKDFKSDQGSFIYDLNEEEHSALEVTATDFAAQSQPLPQAENDQINVTLKLKPVKALRGIVVTEDDQPVSGASVALVTSEYGDGSAQLAAGRLRSSGSRTTTATTDAGGNFTLPSPPDLGMVVAASGSAYGHVTIADVRASGVLKVRSLGRIEGRLVRGGVGVAGQELLLSSATAGQTSDFTDAGGNFAFENVPAGTNAIVRLVQTNPRSRMHSHRTEVVVAPGQTTSIVLGDTDATVQAHVRFETAPTDPDYFLSAELRTVSPQLPPGLSNEQRSEYMKSPEWQQQIRNMKHYSASVGPDGSVVLDSIVPGQYTLTVTAVKSGDEPTIIVRQPLARGEAKITIPAGTDPSTPVQVGEVLLKPAK